MAKNLGSDLVSVWLRQSQDYGQDRSGGSFYFRGDTIYSYGTHFLIAKLATAPNGDQVIFFTTRTYSVTTAKHISKVRQGIRNTHRKVLYVNDPTEFGFGLSNIEQMKRDFAAVEAKHAKARKPALYSGELFHICERCRDYCEVMLLPVPIWAELRLGIEPGKPLMAAIEVCQEERRAS
jgi:hypothetical protein